MSFLYIYQLIKTTFMKHPDMQGWEQIVFCLFILATLIWYIIGLLIRFDDAGRVCVDTYLLKAGLVFNWFYGVTLGLLAMVCFCVCLVFSYARLNN